MEINSSKIDNTFLEYYSYLMHNEIETDNSIDFVFSITDDLQIPHKYLKTFCFDYSLKSNGIYIPEEKKIINTNKINACYKLNFYSREKMILSYFNLLLHELTHVYQKNYKDNYDDDKSTILQLSEKLKFLSNNDYYLYSLFPDEVNANITSSSYLYTFGKNNNLEELKFLEKSLIYFLTLGIINSDNIINSQLKYLYKLILDTEYEENFNSLNDIETVSFGVTKSNSTMKKLIKSYQTQEMCFDIDNIRR